MSVAELLPTLKELDRADKLRVMQFLEAELGGEEEMPLVHGAQYNVWSPYKSYGAANALLAVLEAEADHDAER